MATDFQRKVENMSEEIKRHLHVDENGLVVPTAKNKLSSELNAIRISLSEVVRANPEIEDYTPEYAKEIEKNLQTVLELSRFVDTDAVRNSSKSEEAIVSEIPEQMKKMSDFRKAYTVVSLNSDQLKYFTHSLVEMGIPFNEFVSAVGEKASIITKGKYKDQVTLLARRACASSRSGQVSLGSIQRENTLQMAGLTLVQKEFYQKFVRDRNLEFAELAQEENTLPRQLSYSNALTNSDVDNVRYSVVFRSEDAAEHMKALIRAVSASNCLTCERGNAYLGNILKAEAKDNIAIEGVFNKSMYSDIYLCADAADIVVKLTKDDLTVYSREADSDEMKAVKTVSRSDKNFLQEFNDCVTTLKRCGIKVVLDSEAKGVDLLNKRERKKLLAQRKSEKLSIPTYNEEFMASLKAVTGKEIKTTKDFKKAMEEYQSKDLFNSVIVEMICSSIDRQADLLKSNPDLNILDILHNTNDKPSLISLMRSYSDYAQDYASFMTMKNKFDLYQTNPTKFKETYPHDAAPTADALAVALNNITATEQDLKVELENFRAEYNISPTEMDVFKNAVATMCGATLDPVNGEIKFSDDIDKVNESCKGLENLSKVLVNTAQDLSVKSPQPYHSLESLIQKNKDRMTELGENVLDERDDAARTPVRE